MCWCCLLFVVFYIAPSPWVRVRLPLNCILCLLLNTHTETVNNPGWAYIYQLSADGSHYELEQELESPVGNNSYFGAGVGIHGDKVIVGADGYRKFCYLWY